MTNNQCSLIFLCLVLAIPAAMSVAGAPPLPLAGTQWEQAATAQAIHPVLLYALALAQTGKAEPDGSLAPWPWTVVSQAQQQRYDNQEAAAAALAQATQINDTQLAVGIMRINLARWRQRITDPQDLLDPVANLRLGAAILSDSLRATPDDLALAVGHFATATDATVARQFGERVLGIAIALGMPPPLPAPKPPTPPVSPQRARVRLLIEAAARRHGVDPAFVMAVAHTESRFNQRAVSPKGARGVMQLMPGTAARYGADARDLEQNIDAGVRYLRDLAERFGGAPELVAAAYNAGEGAVVKHQLQVPPFRETQHYVPQVMAARRYFSCAHSH